MRTGLCRTIVPLLVVLGLASGCAQTGFPTRRPMMVGSLKTEIVRLEQEKEHYRQQTAELERENARIAEDLIKERAFSEDLEARLADARSLLDRKGLAAEPGFYDNPPAPPIADWDDGPPTARTHPASDPSGSDRKAPFAQIGGGLRQAPGARGPVDDRRDGAPLPPAPREAPGPQSRREAPARWLPVSETAAQDSSMR